MNKKRIHKKQTGSTNNDLRQLALEGAPEGTIMTADAQTSGKGRRGRSWEVPAGTSLLFSLLLRPGFAPDIAPQITLIMALAVTKAVREQTGLEAMIKWPNDVVVNRKKICGILTEMELKDGGIGHVVVGTGINMNQTSIPEELKDSATSLWLELSTDRQNNGNGTGQNVDGGAVGEAVRPLDRDRMLDGVMEAFEGYYACFLQTNDLSGLMAEYNKWLVSSKKEVRVLDPKGEFTGISQGINEKGELLVTLPSGETTAIYAGEVSVRGLYGYV